MLLLLLLTKLPHDFEKNSEITLKCKHFFYFLINLFKKQPHHAKSTYILYESIKFQIQIQVKTTGTNFEPSYIEVWGM